MPEQQGRGTRSNILVAVDGSAAGVRAARHAAARWKSGRSGVLHLLHVQPPLRSGEVSVLVTMEMAQALRQREAERALKRARAVLTAARVPHETHVVRGPVAETIVRHARSLRCGEIVMGTRGMGDVARLVLGSVATRVVRLSRAPVTLVK